MYVSLMEQPTLCWICFEFCVRFTPYFKHYINETILEILVLYDGFKLLICCIKALGPSGFMALM